MRNAVLRSVLILAAILLVPGKSWAQSCSFSVTNINFGSVDTLSGAAADTTGTLNVTCIGNPGTQIRICPNINAGSGGATSGIRHLRNAANRALNYNLYQDSARSVPWGSVEQPTIGSPLPINVTVGIFGTVSTSRTIYARVLGGQQSAATGLYTSIFSGGQVRFNYRSYTGQAPACSSVTQNITRPSFNVQANIIPNCRVSAQNINFGNQGVLDTNVDAAGMLGVTCTSGTAYTVGLNNGLTGTGPTARRMTLGNQAVTYGLYKNAARSEPWGNSGGQLVTGTGAGATQNLSVYGRVPPQATPSPGTYSDTVVVTVTY